MVLATLEALHQEPLQLPDLRRLERMQCWPGWVGSRIASLNDEARRNPTGKWRQVPTIPTNLILKAGEREAIEAHVAALDRLCNETPENSAAAEASMHSVITTMMLAFPTTTQNETSSEVRGELFLDALDDMTVWSVQAALRKWGRGDCGLDNQRRPYDYRWCPAPADLRRIAFTQMWCIRSRSHDLRRLLSAEPRIEYSDEHCREMRERLAGLFQSSRTSPVGRNGSGGVSGGEPDKVPTVGRGQRHKPGLKREGGCRRHGDRRK